MPVTPGVPGANLPPGDDAIIRRIQELERAVRELSAANPLATAGLVPGPNALTVQGNLNVTGTENVSGTLNVTGPMTVGGTLSLPNGIINNAALANPVIPVSAFANNSGYVLPAGFANRVTQAAVSFTVPTGSTRAIVFGQVSDSGTNSTASSDYIYSYLGVTPGGSYGKWPSATTPPGYFGTTNIVESTLVTGLTAGSTVTMSSQPFTLNNSWAASSNNITTIVAICLFLS